MLCCTKGGCNPSECLLPCAPTCSAPLVPKASSSGTLWGTARLPWATHPADRTTRSDAHTGAPLQEAPTCLHPMSTSCWVKVKVSTLPQAVGVKGRVSATPEGKLRMSRWVSSLQLAESRLQPAADAAGIFLRRVRVCRRGVHHRPRRRRLQHGPHPDGGVQAAADDEPLHVQMRGRPSRPG